MSPHDTKIYASPSSVLKYFVMHLQPDFFLYVYAFIFRQTMGLDVQRWTAVLLVNWIGDCSMIASVLFLVGFNEDWRCKTHSGVQLVLGPFLDYSLLSLENVCVLGRRMNLNKLSRKIGNDPPRRSTKPLG